MQTDPPQITHTMFHKGISWNPGQRYLVTVAVMQREDERHMCRPRIRSVSCSVCERPVRKNAGKRYPRSERPVSWCKEIHGGDVRRLDPVIQSTGSGRMSYFLTLCPDWDVSIWLCMCERVCECVRVWQASQYPSSRRCIKGCDLLGRDDSSSGPCQTEYSPLSRAPTITINEVLLSLSLSALSCRSVCVNTSSPSNIPALHRKWEIRRRERRKIEHHTH